MDQGVATSSGNLILNSVRLAKDIGLIYFAVNDLQPFPP
jgi:hypothetical protein